MLKWHHCFAFGACDQYTSCHTHHGSGCMLLLLLLLLLLLRAGQLLLRCNVISTATSIAEYTTHFCRMHVVSIQH